MSPHRPGAPPTRNGVSPSCVVLPQGVWPTVVTFLLERFPGVPAVTWHQRIQDGDVVDDQGQRVTADCAFTAGRRLYYYRALPTEPPIPFEAVVLWRDEHLLVVDKPHFLPVMPSGKYLQETVLVRLKNALGLHDLTPIHRIDRDTAGLVLFSVRPDTRDAYHALFRARQVAKTYEAIAAWNPNLPWPLHRESRIDVSSHFMRQAEVPGTVNAITDITPVEVVGPWARYRLQPVTGQRHQLRVHMAALGLPLLGDGIYPQLTPEGSADYAHPLQLLAQRISFTDPVSGVPRQFESARSLTDLRSLTTTT